MAESFWKMRPETLRPLVGALLMERRDALWPRLLAPLCSIVKDGGQVGDLEQVWIGRWLVGQGLYDVYPDEVQVVQLSRAQAAAMLDGRDVTAERAISGLMEVGVLTLIHKGQKGHSSLYCVNPGPGAPAPANDPPGWADAPTVT